VRVHRAYLKSSLFITGLVECHSIVNDAQGFEFEIVPWTSLARGHHAVWVGSVCMI
jgi:hypothetical protein